MVFIQAEYPFIHVPDIARGRKSQWAIHNMNQKFCVGFDGF